MNNGRQTKFKLDSCNQPQLPFDEDSTLSQLSLLKPKLANSNNEHFRQEFL